MKWFKNWFKRFKNWFKKKDTTKDEDNEFATSLQQALEEALQSLSEEKARAESLFYKGVDAYSQGDFRAARDAWADSLRETQALIADGRADLRLFLALTRMGYAACLDSLGELEAARTAYQHTLDEYQALIADGRADLRPDLAGTRMNYANCLKSLGELETARTAYQHTLDEYEALIADGRADLRPELALTRMNYALCLYSLGELETARTAYQHTLDEYQALIADGRADLRPDLARTRMNYANCLDSLGELEAARTASQHSLDEYQALIADGRAELRPELAGTRMNYALCLANLGELEAARTAYQHSLDEYQALIADGRADLRPGLALIRYNLANCLKHIGDYAATENQYQTSYAELQTLQQVGQLPLDAIKMVQVIADWYQNPKRPNGADKQGAFDLAKQGLDWLETLLNRVSDAAKTFLLEQNLELFHLAADLALALNQPAAAYVILERSKSRVLVEQMLREKATPGPTVDAPLREQYQHLPQQLRELVQTLGTGGSDNSNTDGTRFFAPVTRTTPIKPEQEQQLLNTQRELEQRLQLVRSAIAKQDAAFGEAIQPEPLTEAAITALLPESVLAIAFEQRPKFLYLYAITADGIPAPLRVDINILQIFQRVYTFKSNIISEIRAKEALDIRDWLTEQLGPAIQSLVDGTTIKDILFIAHQAWHLLPLHLIQLHGQPLSHDYAVRYIPSLQVLRLIHQRHQAAAGQGCIIANPNGNLPSAEQEGQTIKTQHRPKDTLLIRQQAKLAPVREHLRQAEHGHFCCHGYYKPNLKAGLKLADGPLEAKELFASLRLPNPRLVILSACESAQIQATLADEYMGLPSSFLFAGAHNVLAALWRVNDASTRLLMEEFYQGLANGLTPTLALQHAQQQLSNMPRATVQARLSTKKGMPKIPYQNPYYWAGFVLIGDGL